MNDAPLTEGQVSTDTCGCDKKSRRVCDVCRTARYVFMACGLDCLRRHQVQAHGDRISPRTETRVRDAQREMNRHAPNVWDRYAGHRAQLMSHVPAIDGHGDVCVLGAGSCSDIDVEQLARGFDQIHLVDLDGTAIERARDRQPAALRGRIVLHGDVDLSGFLGRLDEWAEDFPTEEQLGQAAVMAAHAIVQSIGRPFDVTVSACVLSQLIKPYQAAWVLGESAWGSLDAALTAVHLATLAGATGEGGAGFMAFDVLSSIDAPDLARMQGRGAEELQMFVEEQTEREAIVLQPDPRNLFAQIASPGLGSLFASPELTLPWLWDIGDGLQVVYGLTFRRG